MSREARKTETMNTQNKDKKTDSWPRWLRRLVRLSFGVCFHRAADVEWIGPFMNDMRVHSGFCLRWVTIGWWRDADEGDFSDA